MKREEERGEGKGRVEEGGEGKGEGRGSEGRGEKGGGKGGEGGEWRGGGRGEKGVEAPPPPPPSLHTTTDGSKFPEVIKVKSTTSFAIIGAMKPVSARHEIPETTDQ